MTIASQIVEDTATELFEDAPCGYLITQLDGTIVKVNRTFEGWTGFPRGDLLGRRRFQDLLSIGGKIYYETHFAPLLRMQGAIKEIALEVTRADGSRLPALVNSVLHRDEAGRPRAIRTTIFDARDRRRYEQELLRARERDRQVALSLQRGLLDGELPFSDAFELAVFYEPADTGAEVGGDWYDVFWLSPGRSVSLVVGDVVGRGLAAAMTMGQLRSAVRALATLARGPGQLLVALDEYSRRYGVGEMATVLYGQLDIVDCTLCFACAGHPPPLIHPAGAEPRFIWEGRSLPINAYPPPLERPQAEVPLSPGTSVLLYTDGLIEHRAQPADQGMEDLIRLVGRAACGSIPEAEPLGVMIESIARALADPRASDDRSLVGLRLTNG